ncbi:uncharacterized protein LOC109844067 isoform X2 [Asparagus officinalis]|uniref:uncharacterized protein LOC109844067 isoform X2 n=1 Tax=Asparagus officinalis TaxID=4686 RepID=UPI00098E0174|nr:uncharacterized protein LOC109844067 isoform X2 [Asparagus officinalis]
MYSSVVDILATYCVYLLTEVLVIGEFRLRRKWRLLVHGENSKHASIEAEVKNIPDYYEAFWKELDGVKQIWKNRKQIWKNRKELK